MVVPITQMATHTSGYLEIIIGPMFSGKTTTLLNIAHNHVLKNKKVIIINHSHDTRYSNKGIISTHDGIKRQCITFSSLKLFENECSDLFEKAHVICINEAQFFDDLKEYVTSWVEKYNKHVVVAGLDGDYKRQKFGSILDLIPISDECNKIKSICTNCSKNCFAPFTIRNHSDIEMQIAIGSNESYQAVCRSCFQQIKINQINSSLQI